MPARTDTWRRFSAHLSVICLAALALAACSAGSGLRSSDQRLHLRELRVADGQIGSRDRSAEQGLHRLVCSIDPTACANIRVYVVDRPEAQARLWPNGMLIVTRTLLDWIDENTEYADAMRHFAVAHELAHRQLGHFTRREQADWNAPAGEREADAVAMTKLHQLGLPEIAGIRLLQTIVQRRGESAHGNAGLRQRIAAMQAELSATR